MVTLAGNILACWQNGAVPAFSPDELDHSTEAKDQFAALVSEPALPPAKAVGDAGRGTDTRAGSRLT